MFYDEYCYWCRQKGYSPNKVAVLCGLSEAAPSQWKKGRTPMGQTQQTIADFFSISLDELNDHTKAYPVSEVDEIRDELFEQRKILFDLSKKATKEDLEVFIKMMKGMVDNE